MHRKSAYLCKNSTANNSLSFNQKRKIARWREGDKNAFMQVVESVERCSYTSSLWPISGIFVQKLFETNLNFKFQLKNKSTNVTNYKSSAFFLISTHWYLKLRIEICLKYFLDKNAKKRLLCSYYGSYYTTSFSNAKKYRNGHQTINLFQITALY